MGDVRRARGRSEMVVPGVLLGVLLSLGIAPAAVTTTAPQDQRSATPAGEARPFIPGEVVVRYRAGIPTAARGAARLAARSRLAKAFPSAGLELVRFSAESSVAAAVAALERRPEVLYAEPNYRYRATADVPDDPLFGDLWGLSNTGQAVVGVAGTPGADVDAPGAWALTTGSPDVVVAVVDTGVDVDHPDLASNIWTNPGEMGDGKESNGRDDDGNGYADDWRGWDWVSGDNEPRDLHGHGTHVAGTIAARGNDSSGVAGVTWSSKIMPLRVLDESGSGANADIAAAFAYAGAMGARVVNASFAGPDLSQAMADAIAGAPASLFVVAAGNEGANNDSPSTPSYPCDHVAPNLVCVAATDQRDRLAGFSNYGTRSVDLAAPGVMILSAQPPIVTAYTESFDADIAGRWVTGGTNDTWDRTTEAGGGMLTDSPGGEYLDGTDSWAAPAADLDLSGLIGCRLRYALSLDLDGGADRLLVEASSGGAEWSEITSRTGAGTQTVSDDLSAFDGRPDVRFRFRLVSDGSGTADGAHLDDVEVRCLSTSYAGDEYAYYSGTSMTAPHVAGVAALVWARFGAASVAEVRNRLLCGAEPLDGLAGKTVTGARLSALRALEDPTCLTLAAPATVVYGRAATLSGKLSTADAVGLAGRVLTIRQRPYGAAAFSSLGTVVTGSGGTWSVAVKPAKRTVYRVTFAGASSVLSGASPARTVQVRTTVSLSVADTTLRLGRSVSFSGRVGPAHAGKYVRLERWTGSSWAQVKSAKTGSSGGFSGTWKPPARGTYRLRIRFPAPDADHGQGVSGRRDVRVS
ncbi:MAG: S8 family serine peptidase [Acidobacteria bacterium]|nr:S8 family serine peptidase [Acidobacteriota bacterium]